MHLITAGLPKAGVAPQEIGNRVGDPLVRQEFQEKLRFIKQLETAKDRAKKRFIQTGKNFWEIAEFMKMSGIGPVGAHTFSAYIQTPHRFRKRGQLIRFCQMAVRKNSSVGRCLRSERLSKAGHGCLKNVAHTAWKASLNGDNEVNGFYRPRLSAAGVRSRHDQTRQDLSIHAGEWRKALPALSGVH